VAGDEAIVRRCRARVRCPSLTGPGQYRIVAGTRLTAGTSKVEVPRCRLGAPGGRLDVPGEGGIAPGCKVFAPRNEVLVPGAHLLGHGDDLVVPGRSPLGRGDEAAARRCHLPAGSGQLIIRSRNVAPRRWKLSAARARERPELWHDQEKYALNAVVGCFSGLDVAVFTAGRIASVTNRPRSANQ